MNGINYYRLTQFDFDGMFESCAPIVVKFQSQMDSESALIQVSPVPFEGHLNIEFFLKEGGPVEFSIVNRIGQIIKTKK